MVAIGIQYKHTSKNDGSVPNTFIVICTFSQLIRIQINPQIYQ